MPRKFAAAVLDASQPARLAVAARMVELSALDGTAQHWSLSSSGMGTPGLFVM
jgi:hypothetical protein